MRYIRQTPGGPPETKGVFLVTILTGKNSKKFHIHISVSAASGRITFIA
jgi:hypothetical protein